MDALQFPLSFFFTRFMNLFSAYIPNFEEDMLGTVWGTMPVRVLVLLVAIVLTGVGAAMSLDMRIIPNPGDGIVQAISDFVGKDVGLVKNCFDVFNICLTTVMCLVFYRSHSGHWNWNSNRGNRRWSSNCSVQLCVYEEICET